MSDEQKIKELERRIAELENQNKIRGPGYNPRPTTDNPDSYWPKVELVKFPKELFDLEDKSKCSECGLDLTQGALCYSCPRINCPCGCGPTIC